MTMGGGDGLLCGLAREWAGGSFLLSWVVVTFFGGVSVIFFSGPVFYKFYWPSQVTYEKWCQKSNPKFPTPEKVRDEIIQSAKALCWAALCPALALWLYAKGDEAPITHYAYCGTTPEYGWGYNLLTFFVFWLASDFWEFAFHWIGHRFPFMWNFHRHHHVFFNPSPFAVIADEFSDQFFRALPLVLFQLFMPTNLDILYGTFTVLFYGTGVYHHCGYELKWPNAHTGFFNTSYHHYLHHSISIARKPYHCGFMFQVWDQLAGSIYKGNCFCVQCSQAKGLRTREQWAEVVLPDYSQLLRPSFWVKGKLLAVLTGTSAADTNEELESKESVMSEPEVVKPSEANLRARGAAALAAAAS